MKAQPNNLEKAAILLLGIGEENAAEILRHMDASEVQKIGMIMNRMKDINRNQVQDVIHSFVNAVNEQTSFALGANDYVKHMLENALGKDKAGGVFNRIQLGIDTTGLEALTRMEAVKIAELLRKEHPQVKALVLSYLDNEKTAEVLASYSDDECSDLLIRIANLGPIQPEILQYLNEVMEHSLAQKKSNSQEANLGGVKVVANILNYMDPNREDAVLGGIHDQQFDLGKEIKDLMFVFDHLVDCDNRSLQTLLRNIPSETLLIALRGAEQAVRNKFFTNMSKRAAELIKDEMETMGPVRISDVEAAQKEIISIATKMRDAGELRLNRGSDESLV